jgi:ankyrin repeat protein
MNELIFSNRLNNVKRAIEAGIDINTRDRNGRTPLFYHTHSFHQEELEIPKLLLENGANPNIQDWDGNTPLFYITGDEITKLLLEYGANPNIRNNDGKTAIMVNGTNVKTLCNYGADPNLQDNNGNTALHHQGWHKNTTKELLKCGADITIKNNLGKNPYDKSKNYPDTKARNLLKNALITAEANQNSTKSAKFMA